MSHIRSLLKRAQKKSYTISVGKLNPAKLANFLEIECFVIVACPENSVIEAKVSLYFHSPFVPSGERKAYRECLFPVGISATNYHAVRA